MTFIANKEFTDRENYKVILKHAIADKGPRVTAIYGFGGKGKTALCNHFLQEIIARQFDQTVIPVHIDFSNALDRPVDQCLLTMRKLLSEKSKIRFQAFDLAFVTYYEKTKSEGNIRQKYPWLFVGESPLMNKLFDVAGVFASGINIVYDAVKDLIQSEKDHTLKRSLDVLADLDRLNAPEIEQRFPEYMAYDLIKHFGKSQSRKKIAFVFDHYEQLWENRSNKTGLGSLHVDAWIRKMVDIFPPETCFVIFGRDKIKWEKLDTKYTNKLLLNQHILDSLSDEDADTFLKKIPIVESNIRRKIISSCSGVPFYLDRQVDIYTGLKKDGKPIVPIAFGNDKEDIMIRYFAHLGDGEEDVLSVFAVMRTVTYEIFNYLRKEGIISRIADFSKIVEHSFFEAQSDEQYVMHSIMRDWLIENKKKNDIVLFNDLNNVLLTYYEKKIEDCKTTGQIDAVFDTYVYNAIFYLKNLAPEKLIAWSVGLCEQSEKHYRLQLWEDIFDGIHKDYGNGVVFGHLDRLNLYYYLSRIKSQAGKYRESEDVAEKAFQELEEMRKASVSIPDNHFFNDGDVYYAYASAMINNNNYQKAREFLFEKFRNKWLMEELFKDIGQFALAESIFWDMYNSKNDNLPGVMYNKGGNILYRQGRYQEALEFFRRSLEDMSPDDPVNIAVAHYCMGKTYEKMGEHNAATEHIQKSIGNYEGLLRRNHPYKLMAEQKLIEILLNKKGALDEEETLRILSASFRTLIKGNPYNSEILELGMLINRFQQRQHTGPKDTLLSEFLTEAFSFKYGPYFAPMAELLQYADDGQGLVQRRLQDIYHVNDYLVRLDCYAVTVLEGADKESMVIWLKEKISLPERTDDYIIRKYQLPFYKNYYLLDIHFVYDEGYSLYLLTNGEKVYFLNGNNLTGEKPLQEDLTLSPDTLPKYIRFFFDTVMGRHSLFVILEKEEDLDWSCANYLTTESRAQILSKIAPLNEGSIEADGSFVYHCPAMFFGGNLFSADIMVKRDGGINMKNEAWVDGSFALTYNFELPKTASADSLLQHLNAQLKLLGQRVPIRDDVFGLTQNIRKGLALSDLVLKQPHKLDSLAQFPLSEDHISVLSSLLSEQQIAMDQDKLVAYELPFSKTYKLHQLQVNDQENYLFFSDYTHILFHDGTNRAIYTLAEKDFIFEAKAVEDYVRLFLDLVSGIHGRFILLEDPAHCHIRATNDNEEAVTAVSRAIKPVEMQGSINDRMTFYSGSILFRNGLFSTNISVSADGKVDLSNESLGVENIYVSLKDHHQYRSKNEDLLIHLQNEVAAIMHSLEGSELTIMVIKGYMQYYMLELQRRIEEHYYY